MLTPYDTTVFSGLNLEKVKKYLVESFITDAIDRVSLNMTNNNVNIVFVTNSFDSEKNIPLFHHPLYMNHKGKSYLCVDIRSFVHPIVDVRPEDIDMDDLEIRNKRDFDFTMKKLKLILAWLDNSGKMRVDLSYANIIYAKWLGDTLTMRFSLDPNDSLKVTIISYLFYQMQFVDRNDWDEYSDKAVITLINKLKYDPNYVDNVVREVKYMGNIEDLITTLREVSENPRLEKLNSGMLITLIANTWYGYEAKMNLSAALECPPLWISIVYNCLVDKSNKNSLITRLTERYTKNKVRENYISFYEDYL